MLRRCRTSPRIGLVRTPKFIIPNQAVADPVIVIFFIVTFLLSNKVNGVLVRLVFPLEVQNG